MKEYLALPGGRYTYADDLINLQDIALSITSIFSDCDNFIISGCQVNGAVISPGYIYLGGKIRKFNGANNIVEFPQYIYENNSIQTIAYESGTAQSGRKIYECAIGTKVPSVNDPVTNLPPQSLKITQQGGVTLKDAFIGKYALALNPSVPQQNVKGEVVIDTLSAVNTFNCQQISFNSNSDIRMTTDKGVLSIKVAKDTHAIEWKLNPNGGLTVLLDNTTLIETVGKRISFPQLHAKQAQLGSLMLQGPHLLDSVSPSDDGVLYINYLGYDYDAQKFRTTIIGNGKRTAMLECAGKNDTITFHANSIFKKSILFNDNNSNSIDWRINGESASIKYSFDNVANVLSILNPNGIVKIQSKHGVDLYPIIKEGGVALSEKYITLQQHNADLLRKVDTNKVYSKEEADDKYVKIAKGFQEIAATPEDKAKRRSEIEAVSLSDVKNQCASLSKKLSDMARTESEKIEVCNNIGAAIASETQSKLKYTQAIFNEAPGLKIKMYGNVVCINGDVTMNAGERTKTLQIPNAIQGIPLNETFTAVVKDQFGEKSKPHLVIVKGDGTLEIQRSSTELLYTTAVMHITLTFVI